MTDGGDSTSGPQAPADRPANDDGGRIALDVVSDGGIWAGLADFETRAHAAARAVALRCCTGADRLEAALALSSDARVQVMNRDFRGMDKPTNVLSFPAPENLAAQDAAGARWLGDIVIAEETLIREAQERGIPVLDHFTHLTVHGLMHLLGFDHESDADAVAMEAHETAILAGLGIADPYKEEETVGSAG